MTIIETLIGKTYFLVAFASRCPQFWAVFTLLSLKQSYHNVSLSVHREQKLIKLVVKSSVP